MGPETAALFGTLQEVASKLQSQGLLVALCSIRLYAAFQVLPATGEQFMQGLVRAGVVVILAAYIAFGLPPDSALKLGALQWLALAAKETFIGVLIAFAASTVFWIAESVGALIDTQTGYNNVQLSNPMSGTESTPVSGMLLQLTIAVFYILGGMVLFVGVMFESFKVWPLLSPLPSVGGAAEVFLIHQADSLMTGVVKFAAPVLLILVLIDLGFGLISRTADKLEPNSLSQPVKGAVAVLVLALLVGVFLEQVRRHLLPGDMLQRLQQMLPG